MTCKMGCPMVLGLYGLMTAVKGFKQRNDMNRSF